MRNLLRLIFSLPKKYIFLCFSIIVIALLMSTSEIMVLASIKPFIQSFSGIDKVDLNNTSDYQVTVNQAIKFLVTVIICGILRVFLIFSQYKIAASISAKISSEAFKKIINQNYINLKSANQSKFLSILIQDIPRTSEAISNFASFVSNIIILIFISSSLLILETKLFIGSSIIVGTAYLLILISFAKPLKLNGENITEFNHKEASLVRSTLASIVDFIVSSSSDAQVKEFRRNEIRLRNSTANTLFYSQTPRYIVETICLTLFTVFILLSISNQSSLIIFAKLGTLLFAFNRVLPSAQQSYAAYAFIKASSLSIKNLIGALTLESKKPFKEKITLKTAFKKDFLNKKTINKLSINNLSFDYGKRKQIKYDDFEFVQGLPTAIVGKSGSGKTTLVELILNLLEPSRGEIKLNNVSIKEIDPRYYFGNISYLSQSPFLFSGSIYENILFGSDQKIDKEELYHNGTMLGLKDEFGDNFLNYQISDFGRNISGGQAQRCSLLKIISNIKPILILDEPSSALDIHTSKIFNELLLSKTKNSILIVITHSKSQSDLFSSKFNL